jgi:hypothetical protein
LQGVDVEKERGNEAGKGVETLGLIEIIQLEDTKKRAILEVLNRESSHI